MENIHLEKEIDKFKRDGVDTFISTLKKNPKVYYRLVTVSYKYRYNENNQLDKLKLKIHESRNTFVYSPK